MTTVLTMKNELHTSTFPSASKQNYDNPHHILNLLAALAVMGSLPGLISSAIILIAVLFGKVVFGPRDALALLVEISLLTLGCALCWLAMSRTIRSARYRETYLRSILENISDGVLTLDEQGGFLSANPALLTMIPEDHLRRIGNSLDDTLRWRQAVFSVSTLPVPGAGSVLIFRDETRRHETERAKDALLATASHELRTPLGAVMNYLELLMVLNQTGKIDTAQFDNYLFRALQNSRRLLRLINDILDQAQLEAGIVQLTEQAFDIRNLLENVLAITAHQLKEKGLSAELSIAPNVPAEITSDSERLRKVLLNLLDNAIKFTSHGGIKLRVSLRDEKILSIEVVDSGPGIPLAQLPDLFKPFRRASNYAEREHQGAGLGLSIAKQIIVRMGGNLSVASIPGTGSTFTISLPVRN